MVPEVRLRPRGVRQHLTRAGAAIAHGVVGVIRGAVNFVASLFGV